MLVNGKFVKDWDKSKISSAHTPKWYRHSDMGYDMERLQSALVWGTPFLPSLQSKLKTIIFPNHE